MAPTRAKKSNLPGFVVLVFTEMHVALYVVWGSWRAIERTPRDDTCRSASSVDRSLVNLLPLDSSGMHVDTENQKFVQTPSAEITVVREYCCSP